MSSLAVNERPAASISRASVGSDGTRADRGGGARALRAAMTLPVAVTGSAMPALVTRLPAGAAPL